MFCIEQFISNADSISNTNNSCCRAWIKPYVQSLPIQPLDSQYSSKWNRHVVIYQWAKHLASQFSNVNSSNSNLYTRSNNSRHLCVDMDDIQWYLVLRQFSKFNIVVNTASQQLVVSLLLKQPVQALQKRLVLPQRALHQPISGSIVPDNTTWTNVANGIPVNVTYTNGATNTLTVTPAAAAVNGTYYYRCVVSVTSCSALNSNFSNLDRISNTDNIQCRARSNHMLNNCKYNTCSQYTS